jgi:two-component system, chemotaxis family, CheB/CheR fusion protein
VRALGPKRGGDVPAIALTALVSEADQRAALRAGFQRHLAKPIDIDRLIEAVAETRAGAAPSEAEPMSAP